MGVSLTAARRCRTRQPLQLSLATPNRAIRELRGLAGVGESEADVAGGSLGERCCENGHLDVVVVVDLGSLFARVGAEDAACVLNEASLERDRPREEQGVEGGAVEAFTDEVARRNDE